LKVSAASAAARFRSSKNRRCSPFGRTACSICVNGQDVMPLPGSLQICATAALREGAGERDGAEAVV
jgi:hypothetical protein